jgi:zinc/manganese transport system permease protein
VLLVAGGGALVALHRPLTAVAFDGGAASALGLRPTLIRGALAVLLAAAVCVSAQGLGNLLALATVVAPPLAVRRHARSVTGALVAGGAVGAAAGVVGVYASYELDVAAGAAVALALCAAAALGVLIPPRRPTATSRRHALARATPPPPRSSPR